MTRFIALVLLLVAVPFAAAACGGESNRPIPSALTPTPEAGTPTPPALPTTPTEPPRELRVAFINLAAPLPIDAADPALSTTFEERLALVVRELKAFDPDVVGFNEASWTKEHGRASDLLVKELKMEPVYARANPWYPGQTRDESDQLVKLAGFEEGELLLVRSDRFPIVKVEPMESGLNPRTSESGERRTALHLVIRGPEPTGDIDIYITHLTGGGTSVRSAQSQFLLDWIDKTRGNGRLIVMGGLGDTVDVETLDVFASSGITGVTPEEAPTCCRASVVGEQPPLTMHTDFLLTNGWNPKETALWGHEPIQRADGSWLYASDHNGLRATFELDPPLPAGVTRMDED